MLQDRRAGGAGAEASWSSVHDAYADASAVAILPHGVDGHLVAEVVAGMRLQRAVLLTSQLHVRRPLGAGFTSAPSEAAEGVAPMTEYACSAPYCSPARFTCARFAQTLRVARLSG